MRDDLVKLMETAPEKRKFPSLSDEDLEICGDHGFEILAKRGSGHTRDAYRSMLRRGKYFEKMTALKIPNPENMKGSICTWINLSKGNLNEREVRIVNELNHPNLVHMYDAFDLPSDNGMARTVIAEEYVDGESLAESLNYISHEEHARLAEHYREKNSGKRKYVEPGKFGLGDDSFVKYFSQLIDVVGYMHHKGILHRDIKPSNILIEIITDRVKLTDLQNAGSIGDIIDCSLPTRGGTAFTHPELLNSLITGEDARATKKTDIYAIGATMFYALTGKKPFDYEVIEDEKGVPITIGDKTIRVAVVSGNKKGRITKEDHEKNLDDLLGMIPRKYRRMLRNCLTFEGGYEHTAELQKDFRQAIRSTYEQIVRGLKVGGLTMGIVGAATFFLTLGIYVGDMVNESQKRTSIDNILRNKRISYNNVSFANGSDEDELRLDIFKPYLEKALEKLPSVWDDEFETNMNFALRGMSTTNRTNRRLFYSIVRSCVVQNQNEILGAYGTNRRGPALLPINWLKNWMKIKNDEKLQEELEDMEERPYRILAASGDYLNANMSLHDNIDDVIAKYFCTREELFRAKMKAETRNLYPTSHLKKTWGARGGRVHRLVTKKGYVGFLPQIKQDLINTAVALYLDTKEDGSLKALSKKQSH